MLAQSGWTTAVAINTYYSRMAKDEIASELARQLEAYKLANPGASKSQLKKQTRYLTDMITQEIQKRYPMLNE